MFNGKVFVRPEAQKTDAKQTNRNLLLSDLAKVDTKPQLEIFADDVRCTHGATVGRLDDTALFYAHSRGVPQAAAERLLTYAFAAEVIEEVALEPVRQRASTASCWSGWTTAGVAGLDSAGMDSRFRHRAI